MRSLRFRNSAAIFVLFFGVALLDALRAGRWMIAALWVAFALMFLIADAREIGDDASHRSSSRR
jgi:hypothetical protein